MDIIEKIDLIEKSPTEEIVTREELIKLFNTISLTYFQFINFKDLKIQK